ncbi:hypothetical protein GCM10010302_03690 [Streptomyces polychromogenes]|uniref:Uncharacterized protein n=1 Tax=Streptomyces polychromogenes TaxID=67342 RepID=A0ABP3ELY3_9ACTN
MEIPWWKTVARAGVANRVVAARAEKAVRAIRRAAVDIIPPGGCGVAGFRRNALCWQLAGNSLRALVSVCAIPRSGA